MNAKTMFRLLLGLLLVGMGILHFAIEPIFVRMMPPYLPAPMTLNRLAGVFEILGGIGIQIPMVRRLAGWGCVALFLSVYIVNIDMLFRGASLPAGAFVLAPHGFEIAPFSAGLWLRLPIQFVFIAWALWVTAPGTQLHDVGARM